MGNNLTQLEKNHSHQLLLHAVFAKRTVPKSEFDQEHIEALLKDAFKNGSIQEPVYGQDQYVAHESLARPIDNDGKRYSISNISNLFYEKGLGVQFDTVTSSMGMKCAENKPITLNISVQSALNPEFFDGIKTRMEKNGLNPEDIIFEILEHDVDPKANVEHLQALKNEGFRFALDDFSISLKDKTVSKENMNRVAAFGHIADFAKIDGPIVRALFEETYATQNRHGKNKTYTNLDFEITLHMIEASLPNAQIIAERVYNTKEANILFEKGITGVQGWDLKPEDFYYTPEAQSKIEPPAPEVL